MIGQDFKDKAKTRIATHSLQQDIPLSCDEIAATLKKDDRFTIVNPHTPQTFAEFWQKNIDISPENFANALQKDIEGTLNIRVFSNGAEKGFRLESEIYGTTDPDASFEKIMTGKRLVEKSRSFDIAEKTIRPGFIQANGMKGGRIFLRNQIELGHTLGCNNVEINAVNVGSWLWTRGFNVTDVNPKYMEYLHAHYDSVSEHIRDKEAKAQIEDALDKQDIAALAAINYDIMPDLCEAGYMQFIEKFHDSVDSEDRINLTKHMMIIHNDWNWRGLADLDDPRDCHRLGECLGGWSDPVLKERAQSYVSRATQAAKPQNLTI